MLASIYRWLASELLWSCASPEQLLVLGRQSVVIFERRNEAKTFLELNCWCGGFAQAVREAVAGDPLVSELIEAMLNARAALWKEYLKLHEMVVKFVAGHELCRRLMQIPGVGPVAALSFVTAIDDPSRFKGSRDVAAYVGLTSRRWQSGKSIDVQGRISRAGDPDVRRALYEAASALLTRFKRKDKIKTCITVTVH